MSKKREGVLSSPAELLKTRLNTLFYPRTTFVQIKETVFVIQDIRKIVDIYMTIYILILRERERVLETFFFFKWTKRTLGNNIQGKAKAVS